MNTEEVYEGVQIFYEDSQFKSCALILTSVTKRTIKSEMVRLVNAGCNCVTYQLNLDDPEVKIDTLANLNTS